MDPHRSRPLRRTRRHEPIAHVRRISQSRKTIQPVTEEGTHDVPCRRLLRKDHDRGRRLARRRRRDRHCARASGRPGRCRGPERGAVGRAGPRHPQHPAGDRRRHPPSAVGSRFTGDHDCPVFVAPAPSTRTDVASDCPSFKQSRLPTTPRSLLTPSPMAGSRSKSASPKPTSDTSTHLPTNRRPSRERSPDQLGLGRHADGQAALALSLDEFGVGRCRRSSKHLGGRPRWSPATDRADRRPQADRNPYRRRGRSAAGLIPSSSTGRAPWTTHVVRWSCLRGPARSPLQRSVSPGGWCSQRGRSPGVALEGRRPEITAG